MPRDGDSLLLRALDRAAVLALAEAAKKEEQQEHEQAAAPVYSRERGRVRGAPGEVAQPVPAPVPRSGADLLVSELGATDAGIGAQIAQVQRWLRDHPDLLRLLDKGIRGEIAEMERRTNRKNVALNVIFTVLGAILGLVLPYVVGGLPLLSR